MAQWYYGSSAGQHGPVPEEEIRAMIVSGGIGPQTLVWREGMPGWQPLLSTPEFGSQAGAGPTPFHGGVAGYYPAVAVQSSGLAVASMVCGIVGYLTCYLVGIFGIPAVICGHMALNRIARSPFPIAGRGMAITGLILGYLGILITLVPFAAILFAFLAANS